MMQDPRCSFNLPRSWNRACWFLMFCHNASHGFMNQHRTFLLKLLRIRAVGYNELATMDARRCVTVFFHAHLDSQRPRPAHHSLPFAHDLIVFACPEAREIHSKPSTAAGDRMKIASLPCSVSPLSETFADPLRSTLSSTAYDFY